MKLTSIPLTDVTVGSADIIITPPQVSAEAEAPEEVASVHAMTMDVAEAIVRKLQGLLESEDLNVADVKDIASMNKDVSAYLKNLGVKNDASAGLETFIARLKA